MKIGDFMTDLYTFTEGTAQLYTKTCDTLKIGNPGRELHKIAVSMFAAPDTVRAAAAWGAELLIVHEPCFYNHFDEPRPDDPLYQRKHRFLEESGLAIFRYHDHPHRRIPDLIAEGTVREFGLKGEMRPGSNAGINRFFPTEPLTAREIARTLEKHLKIRHVRICGDPETECRQLSLALGTPGHIEEELRECDAVLTGEICEWAQGEYVRDMAQLGMKRALLVLGHIPSEQCGMRLLAEKIIPERYPALETKFFANGEVYTYA